MLTVRSTINIASQTVPPIIPVVQGDTGRAILFTLADFTIPTGATATYYVQKPSGEAVYNNATIDGNNVLVNLTAQSIIEKGDNYGQVRIAVGEDIVTSFDFILLVKEFRGIDAVQSLTEMNIFDKAVEQAADAIDEVKTDALDDMDSAKTTALDDIGDAKEAALQEIEQTTGNFADDFSASATYAAGDYVMHSGQLYRFTANHAAGAWTGSDAEAVTVGEELTDLKAETTELKDDFHSYHSELGAGYADQIVSSIENTDSVPYNFRKVPYDATLEQVEGIVGVDVVVNQLMRADTSVFLSGLTITTPKTGTYRLNGEISTAKSSALSISLVSGHVALLSIGRPNADDVTLSNDQDWQTNRTTYMLKAVSTVGVILFAKAGTYENVDCVPQVFDLTAMFGTQIADYAYSLEQSTAGAGVAWLKKHFSKIFDAGYIPYNAGTMVHVSGLSAHKTVGFNQWDEVAEVGGIDMTTGQNAENPLQLRTKNYIAVLPGEQVYIKHPVISGIANIAIRYYRLDKSYIGYTPTASINQVLTIPEDCYYIRFSIQQPYGTTYNHDICINISDPTKNGTYEPYTEHTYPLDSTIDLHGILKLDSANNLYADGDVYKADGTVSRRYGVVDLGTLNWYYDTTTYPEWPFFFVQLTDKKPGWNNMICSKYPLANGIYNRSEDKVITGAPYNYNNNVIIRDSAYSDSASFKTAMSGVLLIYELATPTTETAEPYTATQICDPNGTEEYISNTVAPVGHVTRYPLDIAGRLDNILSMPTADGTYTLRATVNNGKVTYSWVSA